jgi:hypothetical protein
MSAPEQPTPAALPFTEERKLAADPRSAHA